MEIVAIIFAAVAAVLALVAALAALSASHASKESERRLSELLRDNAAQQLMLQRNQTELLDRRLAGAEQASSALRETMEGRLTVMQKNSAESQASLREAMETRLSAVQKGTVDTLLSLRNTIDARLDTMTKGNEAKLEQMRVTVDEKLSSTLEKRLNESFSLVSERLEAVYKGLGDMQSLAAGVGDLKKVLVNVKTRGTWGEMQLGSLLEQVLTREQYAENIAVVPHSSERVEFAIILPGKEKGGAPVYLPIDSKFPQEDYQRLTDAQEAADADAVAAAAKQLESAVKLQAKTIHDKYIVPPYTTDFAVMFLPVEGLYAEVLRRPGLCDTLQRDWRVAVAGPTTLSALLNSLQMGFRTLAIEKRSSEVWTLLGKVKGDFGKFAAILEKTQQRLQQASASIDDATKKTRTIERTLRSVEALPGTEEESPVLLTEEMTEAEA